LYFEITYVHTMQIRKIPPADAWSARVRATNILVPYPEIKTICMLLREQQY